MRQLMVIPRGRRVGRQNEHIRLIDTWIELRRIGTVVEGQNLRQEDHPVEIQSLLRLQDVRQKRGARRAVAFAEQILGRVPAIVAGKELDDEAREGMSILIHTIERLRSEEHTSELQS